MDTSRTCSVTLAAEDDHRWPKATAKQQAAEATKDELLQYYRDMLLIRRFEERAGQLYGMGLIGGFCHLYIGQEAVVVGMQAALRDGDQVITAYRDHGHMLAAGMTANGVMAELTAAAAAIRRARAARCICSASRRHSTAIHGIVGAQVSLGTGLAFANKYRKDGKVCLTYFGDGAANQGQVYESFNMAALWKLPVVYIVENNQYAMGTAIQRSSSETHLHKALASTSLVKKSTAWMSSRCAKPANALSSGLEQARVRCCSR